MASGPLLFGNVEEAGNEQLAGASPLAMNVVVDGKGAVRRRPGISAYSEAPSASVDSTGIIGLHLSATTNRLLAIGNASPSRAIYQVAGFFATEINATASGRLAGTLRPVFTEYDRYVMIAGGAEPQQIDTTSVTSQRLGASSSYPPPRSTHIVANSSRLLSNDLSDRGNVRYSALGVTGVGTWEARRYFAADADPDPVVALGSTASEVFVWGTRSTQIYTPDASSVYTPQRTVQKGCGAPYSIVRIGDGFAWFTDEKEFVISDGRSKSEISLPIKGALDGITTYSDCFGYRMVLDAFDCVVWTFPTDGRTFCWQRGGGWSQWAGWTAPNYSTFLVTAHLMRSDNKINVVGLSNGKIAKLDASANTDLTDTIKAEVKTGFINRGSDARKWSKAVRLTFRRGTTSSTTTAPVARLSWRDDGGEFSSPIDISLGTAGDYVHTVEIRSGGVYRRRQWCLEFTDNADVVLAAASEDFEVLGV